MRDHQRQLRDRYLLRAFLDRKAARGRVAAIAFAFAPPTNLRPIMLGVLSDKLGTAQQPATPASADLRTLLDVHPVGPASATSGPSHGSNPVAQAPAASSAMQVKR
jgi:hypothetical protein